MAGSTHEGEERIVLSALRLLGGQSCWRRSGSSRRGIRSASRRSPRSSTRRTSGTSGEPELAADGPADALEAADVLLLDTIGELAGCFQASTACFIGGSLVPIGGHNLLEPARCGVPIIVGPHLDSVRELAERLESVGAAAVVSDADRACPGGVRPDRCGAGRDGGRGGTRRCRGIRGESRADLAVRCASSVGGGGTMSSDAQPTSRERLVRSWSNRGLLRTVLAPLEWGYRLGVAGRRVAFRAGVFRTRQAGVPVVSVGNLTVGGTGKTPATLWLATSPPGGWSQARYRHPGVRRESRGSDRGGRARWSRVARRGCDRGRGSPYWPRASEGPSSAGPTERPPWS